MGAIVTYRPVMQVNIISQRESKITVLAHCRVGNSGGPNPEVPLFDLLYLKG